MIKICRPFKSATPKSIAQGFSDSHKANDYYSFYGDWLVAPFNCKIAVIRGVQNPEDIKIGDNEYLEGGCGIRMVSMENPALSCVYWHCQDVFPVKVGDFVLQCQPVAMEGNTGFVIAGGVPVPVDQRLIPPYKGTHVHISFGTETEYMDFSKYVDYTIPINFDLLATIKNMIAKIISLIKK